MAPPLYRKVYAAATVLTRFHPAALSWGFERAVLPAAVADLAFDRQQIVAEAVEREVGDGGWPSPRSNPQLSARQGS